MKNYLFILLLAFVPYFGFSQTNNQTRINELNTLIDAAVERQDFNAAQKYKKERDTRIEIEDAIKAGDFETAQRLKNNMNGGQQNAVPSPIENQTADNNTDTNAKKQQNNVGEYQKHPSIKRGFYMGLALGGGGVSTAYGGGWGGAFGFFIGTKFGKYEYNKRFRVMFDMEFINLSVIAGNGLSFSYYGWEDEFYNTSEPTIGVCLLRPGASFSFAINDNMGIEASAHFGLHIEAVLANSTGHLGVSVSPRFLFRIKKFGVGLKFVYSPFFELDRNSAYGGWGSAFRITPTVGIKF